MPTIAKHNEVITVIIIFAVEPEQQQELINTIVEFVEADVKHQPGFVSSSLHKSLDGIRVLNYAQYLLPCGNIGKVYQTTNFICTKLFLPNPMSKSQRSKVKSQNLVEQSLITDN